MSRIADALERAGLSSGAPETPDVPLTLESFRASHETPAAVAATVAASASPVRAAAAPRPAAAIAAAPPCKVRLDVPEVWPNAMATCAQNERLVASPRIGPVAGHQYRKLASTLHQLQTERRLRSVLVTSAVAGEGKSLTAANLALTLSESFFRRVLLIDADLRRPTLDALFGTSTSEGLSEMLAAGNDPVAPLIAVSKGLSLLAAGRPNPDPVGVLTSDRMRHLLEDAVELFDWVIIDSPPIGLFPDPELLSMVVDGVVMVVRAEGTSYVEVQRAIATVTPERIVGVVLNRTEKVTLSETGYYRDDHRYYPSAGTVADKSAPLGLLGA